MKLNKALRNKLYIYVWSNNFLARISRTFNGERTVFSTHGTGIAGILTRKDEFRLLSDP